MGYSVKRQSYGRGWKVLFIWHEAGKERSRALRPEEFRGQFGGVESIEDARAIASRLNAESELQRHDARKRRIHERLEREDLTLAAHFPGRLLAEFKAGKLYGDSIPDTKDKVDILWRSCERCIASVGLQPGQWEENREQFYAYFRAKAYALSTVQKMLLLMNRWGKFLCRKEGKFFEPLPAPKHRTRQHIADAHRSKRHKPGGNRVSLPLSFERLAGVVMPLEHHNWLYVSIAFGLRPEEIDERSGAEPMRVERQGKVSVLCVYQGKLKLIDHDKRWKYVPAILPEQRKALQILEQGPIERPSRHDLEKYFGPGYTHYAGRNNFVPMMFSHERPLEEVSPWMGHKSIKTTWGYYQKLLSRRAVLKKSA